METDRYRRRIARLASALLLVSVALVAALPSASSGLKIPKLPKVPKHTTYPVTIDVAGYVDFNWTFDNRQACVPGLAKNVAEEFSFEFGAPRRTTVNIIKDAVSIGSYVTGGQAKAKASLDGYQTTNYCYPTPLAPEPPKPECKTLSGKLGAVLTPQKRGGDDEIAALDRGVLLTLQRKSNTTQDGQCLRDRPTPEALDQDQGVNIDTAQVPYGALTVPAASALKFWKLRKGGRVRNTIKISGRCDRADAGVSSLPDEIKRCTVHGTIVLIVKRIG